MSIISKMCSKPRNIYKIHKDFGLTRSGIVVDDIVESDRRKHGFRHPNCAYSKISKCHAVYCR